MNEPYPVPPQPYVPVYPQPPVPSFPRRRIGVGTFLIPLAFMLLHLLVITLSYLFYMFLWAFSRPGIFFDQFQSGQVQDQSELFVYAMLVAMPVLIAIYLGAIYGMRRRGQPYVYFERPRAVDVLRSAVIAVGCLGVANLIMLAFSKLAEQSPFVAQELDTYSALSENLGASSVPLFLQILAMVIVVPIAEELLFRGIILGELRRALPDWLSITVCGLLFALFHMNFIQSSYVLIAGLALSAVTLWGRSIWLAILLHALYNFWGSTAQILLGDSELLQSIFFYFQLVCVALSIFLAIRFYQKRKRDPNPLAQVL